MVKMFAHFLAKFNYPLSWKAVRLILKIFKQESERQHTQSTFRGEILCSSENLNASNLLNILDKNILKQTNKIFPSKEKVCKKLLDQVKVAEAVVD